MATRRSNGEGGLSWNEARRRWIGRASLGYSADGKRRIGTSAQEPRQKRRTSCVRYCAIMTTVYQRSALTPSATLLRPG
jgi:hypothetical protein